MSIPHSIVEAFFAGTRGPLVRFVINDSIRVVSGEHAGTVGAVIALLALEPEVLFLIERGDTGRDIQVGQSSIELLDAQSW